MIGSPTLAYGTLALVGRLTLAEATVGAALWEPEDAPATPREAARMLLSYSSAGTGKMRINCRRCDGRGFFRGYAVSANEAIAVFCDDCEGDGYILAELDA